MRGYESRPGPPRREPSPRPTSSTELTTLDVLSEGGRDEAKAAATAALLAGGWYPHGDWAGEPYPTTVIVKQTPADYDTENPMAGVPPQAELRARLTEVYAQPASASPQPSWRERP